MTNEHRCCPSHCCIDPSHGCKYSYEDCPVVLGVIKQTGLCEYCYDNIDEGEMTKQEQREHIDALWETKHNPRILNECETFMAELGKKYGRKCVLGILRAMRDCPDTLDNAIVALQSLKEIE